MENIFPANIYVEIHANFFFPFSFWGDNIRPKGPSKKMNSFRVEFKRLSSILQKSTKHTISGVRAFFRGKVSIFYAFPFKIKMPFLRVVVVIALWAKAEVSLKGNKKFYKKPIIRSPSTLAKILRKYLRHTRHTERLVSF